MLKEIRPAIVMLVALTLITGLVYPLAMTGIAEVMFPVPGARQPDRAGRQGRRLGADRAGVHRRQVFPRPAVGDQCAGSEGCDQDRRRALQCGQLEGSNLGPTSKALADRVKGDVEKLKKENPSAAGPGRSGDHLGQRPRPRYLAGGGAISRCRGSPRRAACRKQRVRALVESQIEGRTFGLLGEPRVNVLEAQSRARRAEVVNRSQGAAWPATKRNELRPTPCWPSPRRKGAGI